MPASSQFAVRLNRTLPSVIVLSPLLSGQPVPRTVYCVPTGPLFALTLAVNVLAPPGGTVVVVPVNVAVMVKAPRSADYVVVVE